MASNNTGLKPFAALGLLVCLCTASTLAMGQACDKDTMQMALQWCASDQGTRFNAWSVCAKELAELGLKEVKAGDGTEAMQGTRAAMIGAAKAAAKAGQIEAAVNVAICCQTGNASMQACLAKDRRAVADWLRK